MSLRPVTTGIPNNSITKIKLYSPFDDIAAKLGSISNFARSVYHRSGIPDGRARS